jgi:hypothetical protein
MNIAVYDGQLLTRFLNVDISVCDVTDLPCDHPLAVGRTDDAGLATLPVPNGSGFSTQGVRVYAQLSSPDIVPALNYWVYPLSEAEVDYSGALRHLDSVTPTTFSAAYAAVGLVVDPNRGSLALQIHDCLGANAPNVMLSASSGDAGTGPAVYTVGGTPSTTATATDATGVAFWLNVVPGSVDVTAIPVALGKTVSHVSVQVRTGAYTGLDLVPTP